MQRPASISWYSILSTTPFERLALKFGYYLLSRGWYLNLSTTSPWYLGIEIWVPPRLDRLVFKFEYHPRLIGQYRNFNTILLEKMSLKFEYHPLDRMVFEFNYRAPSRAWYWNLSVTPLERLAFKFMYQPPSRVWYRNWSATLPFDNGIEI